MFPHYKKFPWFFLKDGWKDLGEERRGTYHSFCGYYARIGKNEDSTKFKYCPMCMEELEDTNP